MTRDHTDSTGGARRHVLIVSPRAALVLSVLFVLLIIAIAMTATRATLMLVAGAALALLLSYPLTWLNRLMPRHIAVLVLLAVVTLLIVLAGSFIVPTLVLEFGNFVQDLPGLASSVSGWVDTLVRWLTQRGLAPDDSRRVAMALQDAAVQRVGTLVGGVAASAIVWVQVLASIFIGTLGALFISIYLLLEAPRLRARFTAAMPERYRRDVDELWTAGAERLSRYFVSMLTVAAIQTVAAWAFLSLLGVPYALLLAAWIGLTSTIPYIGTWFGGLPAIAVASLQSPLRGLATFGMFFLVTTVIGNVITPRIQGAAVNVHPVIVLLTVIAAGEVFGLVGLFIAVPALAIGRVLFDFLIARVQIITEPPLA